MCELPSFSTKIDPMYIINMRIEGNFPGYAKAAIRLLTVDKADQIQLSACGMATLYLMKVSSILTEYYPALHKLTTFTYSKCMTCEKQRQSK